MKDRRYSNRGQGLEHLVKFANEQYERLGIAFIRKQNTEFIPIRNNIGKVCTVKVEHKATFDFLGRVSSTPIAIECKNTNTNCIRWDAVQENQYEDMNKFTKQQGTIGIVLVSFSLKKFYAIPWSFWKQAYELRVLNPKSSPQGTIKTKVGEWAVPNKKSIRAEELPPEFEIKTGGKYGLDYLRSIDWNELY